MVVSLGGSKNHQHQISQRVHTIVICANESLLRGEGPRNVLDVFAEGALGSHFWTDSIGQILRHITVDGYRHF